MNCTELKDDIDRLKKTREELVEKNKILAEGRIGKQEVDEEAIAIGQEVGGVIICKKDQRGKWKRTVEISQLSVNDMVVADDGTILVDLVGGLMVAFRKNMETVGDLKRNLKTIMQKGDIME